ncbi:MAG TPA: hypothetical protein VD999_05865 [Vitreimonas sp.]|nr:hypothetical protein [Vitreimonas sp.]
MLNEEQTSLYDSTQPVILGAEWLARSLILTQSEMAVSDIDSLEECLPQLAAAITLQAEYLFIPRHSGTQMRLTRGLPINADVIATTGLATFLSEAVSERKKGINDKELEIVMLIGHQGSGKGVVAEYFEAQGYTILTMSEIVRQVVEAWGLNSSLTEDKIVGGQILKQYFGLDILVRLGIDYLQRSGKSKILIDGPRVPEEVEAAKMMGARLYGIVTDLDGEKDRLRRKELIIKRSQEDVNRAQDAVKFDIREAQEADKINALLRIESVKIFVNNAPSVGELNAALDVFFAQERAT